MNCKDFRDILAGIAFFGLVGYVTFRVFTEPIYPPKTYNLERAIPSARHFDFNNNGKLDEGEIEAYRTNFEEYISTIRQNLLFRVNREIRDYTEESH